MSETSSDIGGHGSKSSSGIWLTYRATKTTDKGEKIPLGKFTKGVKQDDGTWIDEEHTYVSGILQNATIRDNPGKPDRNVDPYTELIIKLGAVKDGTPYTYLLPFKAGSTAAMSLSRRLPLLTRGELVNIGAFVKDGAAAVSIQRCVAHNNIPIAPVDSGVDFMRTEGLSGAALKIARTQNEGLRESWVIKTVRGLPYFEEWGQQSTPDAAPIPPANPDEFDEFAD